MATPQQQLHERMQKIQQLSQSRAANWEFVGVSWSVEDNGQGIGIVKLSTVTPEQLHNSFGGRGREGAGGF